MTNESRISTSGIDSVCINTIRTLAVDAVQKANSGHPGAPMGLAAKDRSRTGNPLSKGIVNNFRNLQTTS